MVELEYDPPEARLLPKGQAVPYDLLLLADETRDAIDKYIHQSSVYVLERDGALVAVCALLKLSEDTVEIKNVAVDSSCQGQGIGQKLLRDVVGVARQMGFRTIVIGTADVATKQLYIYNKLGFREYETKKWFFVDNYPEPIYENGVQLKHMVMLKMEINRESGR